jgi:hypothetical protein
VTYCAATRHTRRAPCSYQSPGSGPALAHSTLRRGYVVGTSLTTDGRRYRFRGGITRPITPHEAVDRRLLRWTPTQCRSR